MKLTVAFYSVLAVALMTAASVSAQETNRDADGNIVKGPYITNSFADNWFISFGAGAEMYLGGMNQNFNQRPKLTMDLSFGKWFTPEVGGRFAVNFTPKEEEHIGFSNGTVKANSFYLYNVHADLLWDMLTTFGGYRESRIYHLIPYLGAGYAQTGRADMTAGVGRSFTVNGGLINKFHLNGLVDLNIEIHSALATTGLDNLTSGAAVIDAPLGVNVGVTFNIGRKTTFQRASTYAAGKVDLAVARAIAEKDKEIAAIEDEKAKLAREIEDLQAQLAARPDTTPVVMVNNIDAGEFPPEVIVFFELGKSTLNAKEDSHFQTFVHFVKQSIKAGKKVTLIGSADKQTGSHETNMRLAKERAELVKRMLVHEYGVPAGELETIGEGGTNNRFDTQEMNRCVYVRF